MRSRARIAPAHPGRVARDADGFHLFNVGVPESASPRERATPARQGGCGTTDKPGRCGSDGWYAEGDGLSARHYRDNLRSARYTGLVWGGQEHDRCSIGRAGTCSSGSS